MQKCTLDVFFVVSNGNCVQIWANKKSKL